MTHPALAPEGERIIVFTPITRPAESMSGPPLLPGFIAASVWMTLSILLPATPLMLRPSPETTPVVSV